MRCWTSRAAAASREATTRAVGYPEATSRAKLGPESTARRGTTWVAKTSSMTWLIRISVRLSKPLVRLTRIWSFRRTGAIRTYDGPAELGRDGDEDDIGRAGRLPEIARELDPFRELEAGEEGRVLP